MNITKISPIFQGTYKESGSELSATEWNNLTEAVTSVQNKVNEVIDSTGSNENNVPNANDSHISMNAKGNLEIVTTESDTVNGKGGKINIEPYSDLQIKPGDDITLYSHHRVGKEDEVSVKVMNGADSDYPVKLQLNTSEILLTTKDKSGDNAEVMDVTVNSNKNTRGYLKVRARAIDLRCEDHGGIAIQPKGADKDGNINKIKFEHGGGDGLEFGTFNTEHTSIFTDDYRFNKKGKIRLAVRYEEPSDKIDESDSTTNKKYIKNTAAGRAKITNTDLNFNIVSTDDDYPVDSFNATNWRAEDDFYDFVDDDSKFTSWEDLVNVANGEFGEIEAGIKVQQKYTKKGKTKNCDIISVIGVNNHESNNFIVENITIEPKHTATIASCSILDIIKLVNYMKDNNQGPWSND